MSANEMWGGRYAAGPSAIMERINASIGFDKRLYAQDIAASKAHCAMLVDQGIIGAEDGAAIQDGLSGILKEIEAGRFEFKAALEDIHMNVESRLKELIGEAAGRLHTARSRNDQVATDLRLWCKRQLPQVAVALLMLQEVFLERAEGVLESGCLPGVEEDLGFERGVIQGELKKTARAQPLGPLALRQRRVTDRTLECCWRLSDHS